METRRQRVNQLATTHGINREVFCEKTGFSQDQWYYWFGSGSRATSPSAEQIHKICETFDWSANFIFFGIGPMRLSEVTNLSFEDAIERILTINGNHAEIGHELLAKILAKLEELTSSETVAEVNDSRSS